MEVITNNKATASMYQRNGAHKISLLNEALNYATNYAPISDLDGFTQSFTDYLYNVLKEQNKTLLSQFSKERLFMFMDIDLKHLQRLEREYKAIKIELTDNYTKVKAKDFNLYATAPQEIERLKVANQLRDTLYQLEQLGVHINYNEICHAIKIYQTLNAKQMEVKSGWVKGAQWY